MLLKFIGLIFWLFYCDSDEGYVQELHTQISLRHGGVNRQILKEFESDLILSWYGVRGNGKFLSNFKLIVLSHAVNSQWERRAPWLHASQRGAEWYKKIIAQSGMLQKGCKLTIRVSNMKKKYNRKNSFSCSKK